ncbi:MAG: putative baseplate assembly protein [Polyangiaceae bacterium]
MTSALDGRRRALEARYPLSDNGIERLVIPGTDPARNPADMPLPAAGLPARIAGRVALVRFVTAEGVAALTADQIELTGAAIRWHVPASALGTVGGLDTELLPDEVTWLGQLAAAIEAAPGAQDRWWIVHTEAALPATASVRLRASAGATNPPAGFEARLSALDVTLDPPFTVWTRSAWLNGADLVLVADQRPLLSQRLRQRVVFLRLANPFGVTDLTAANLSIQGGARVPDVAVRWAWPLSDIASVVDAELTAQERTGLLAFATERAARGDAASWLVICTEERGDFSLYTLRISGDPLFDVLLSAITINFKIDCATQLDCKEEAPCVTAPPAAPVLDYLTRDFAGFRRLLADRMSVLGAVGPDASPAGVMSVLVELIAARADQLAYAQDAVATEAYLHTARLRPSVRRHARLLDYRLHEGVNARAFVHLVAAPGVDRAGPVEAGDLFLTRIGESALLAPSVLEQTLPPETQVFRALLPLRRLAEVQNAIEIYAWGEEELCLPRRTTRCTLVDPGRALLLARGDLLVLEATVSASTGAEEDADPALRHVVRLTKDPVPLTDPLMELEVLDIEWDAEDALPFDLPVLRSGSALAVARGNVVLVDHGRPASEVVALVPWGSQGRVHARLRERGLTFATPAPDAGDMAWTATAAARQSPRDALPDLSLAASDGTVWRPQKDLLASDRSAAEVWVEMESDARAWVRFGDGTVGRAPPSEGTMVASYRTGNGALGNVGAEAIAHLLSTRIPDTDLARARNPLPALGGVDPESLDVARSSAPYAFRTQERAVTLADWAEVAKRHREVQRAVARLHWTGSWHTVRVHIDRVEGRPVDDAFIEEMTAFLDRYRLAGYDLEVAGPVHVPLDIVLSICVAAGAWADAVAGALRAAFGTGYLQDGTRAFFHPDNFTFGDSVFLSQVVARAMDVPGVRWVDTRAAVSGNRFRRWSSSMPDALGSGVLPMGPLEIARCDSDPNAPEHGRIVFHVEGGA